MAFNHDTEEKQVSSREHSQEGHNEKASYIHAEETAHEAAARGTLATDQ